MKYSDLQVVAKGVGQSIKPLVDRLDALERRLGELQSKTLADCWRGTFEAGTEYKRGDLLTAKGALWLAERDTDGRPGSVNAWRLIAKSGENAR